MTDPADVPPEPPGATPARTVARRTSLPGGRAVVGGLLVAVAALGTYAAYDGAAGGPSTTYVVAAVDIDPGTRVAVADLRLEAMRLPRTVADSTYVSLAELDGAVAVAPLRQGELVQHSAVIPPGPGETSASPPNREFSFAVERTRAVSGTLDRGERVDLLATYGTGDTARTHVVVRDALVSDIDKESGDTIGAASTVTITLSLPSADHVLEAAHATQVAEVTLVRATRSTADGDSARDVFGGPDLSDQAGGAP